MKIFVVATVIIVILIGSVVFVAQSIPDTTYLSVDAKLYFLNWYGYDGDCSDTSVECERYFETVQHLSCYLVYGHDGFGTDDWNAHMWNIVMIDGVPHEFESTTFKFKDVSETYSVQDIQEGFYVDGVKYEKNQELNNWKGLILQSYVTRETNFKYESGLQVLKDNQTIEGLVFVDIPIGITVWSSNNHIIDCTFTNCDDEGILLLGGNNVIEDCVFYMCVDGIELQKSSDNIFVNCRFLSNSHAGIDAICSNNNNNLFSFCLFHNNLYGCYFKESKNNEFVDCTFLDNEIDIEERK